MSESTRALRLLAWLLVFLPLDLVAQSRLTHPRVVSLPQGKLTRISSPDRTWILIFEFPAADEQVRDGCPIELDPTRKLWIQKRGSNQRRLVRHFEPSAEISWAPDSQHFFVNDASGSTDARSYVYDPEVLQFIDLMEVLTESSPRAGKFEGDHLYLDAERWLNSQELLVRLNVYGNPNMTAFSGTYRIRLDGTLRTIREEVQ